MAKRRRKTLAEVILRELNRRNVRKEIARALIREATEGNKSGSVRQAAEGLIELEEKMRTERETAEAVFLFNGEYGK